VLGVILLGIPVYYLGLRSKGAVSSA